MTKTDLVAWGLREIATELRANVAANVPPSLRTAAAIAEALTQQAEMLEGLRPWRPFARRARQLMDRR